MNIVVISDPHLGKPNWKGRGANDLKKLLGMRSIDLLLVNGDVGESPEELDYALGILSEVDAAHKLWTCGNNDVDKLEGDIREYYDRLQERVGVAGFHVLDRAPYRIGDIAFVGSMGWYDGSLWRTPVVTSDEWPNTREETSAQAERYFAGAEAVGRLQPGYTSQQFFADIQARLFEHLEATIANPAVSRIVVCTHFVTSGEFVLYGDNPKYEYLNWYMGWDAAGTGLYSDPKVVLGIVGHTHRHKTIEIDGTPVRNCSGWEQPSLVEIPERQ